MAYDTKTLPIISTIPLLQPVELPTMMIKPPTVIMFETCNKTIIQEGIDLKWLDDVSVTIKSIKNILGVTYLDENRGDINGINQYATVCSTKLINRLHGFLRTRVPLQRTDLLPGRHWVWNSFRIKLKKIAVMMIMSGHIVEYNDLNSRNDDKCILSQRHNFIAASSSEEDLDGSYLSFDKKRSIHFRSGTAEVGMNRR